MDQFWFWIAAFSALLSIFLWIKDILKSSNGQISKLVYPITFLILSSIAIFQYYELDDLKKIENEAEIISQNWPEPDYVPFLSKGERFGIILSGQTFLEKHKAKFPDTYNEFRSLLKGRLGNYESKRTSDDKYSEYDDLEDVCSATITMINNFKPKENKEQ